MGGDWALAHGDLEALSDVARQLAQQVSGPLCLALTEVHDQCHSDPDRACAWWNWVRGEIASRAADSHPAPSV
jgi:hypothetical protein